MIFEDKIRQFQETDFKAFRRFIQKSFSPQYVLAEQKFLNWQYGKPPEFIQKFEKKGSLSINILKDRAEVLAYLGIIPLKYRILGKAKKANVYANLFVDLALRKLGPGALLLKKGMEGVDYAHVVGYKPEIFSIYQRLGDWRQMGNFFRYLIIFNAKAAGDLLIEHNLKISWDFFQFKSKTLFASKLSFKYIRNFDSDFDNFWRDIREKYKITVERTKDYLNWRYAGHPYFKYSILTARNNKKLVGYLIYRFEDNQRFKIARIIDFISLTSCETDLLNRFIMDVSKKGADAADFMFSGDYYHKSLKSIGFFEVSKTIFRNFPVLFNPVSYKKNFINFAVWTQDKNISQNAFYNQANWYLTKGDGDADRPNPK